MNLDMVVRHILSIACSYMNVKQEQYGYTLKVSAPNLVTFLKYDDMDTTNNTYRT